MRSPSSITFAGLAAALLVSGCSVVTSLDGWTFGNEQAVDAGHDAGPMDASPGEDAGRDCASGLTDCGGECVDLDSSPLHCGACANACTVPPNSVPLCSAGGCGFECAAGFADCNGEPSDGCEIEIASDPLHCGGCAMACETALSCREGTCRPKLLWAQGFGDIGSAGRAAVLGAAMDPEGNVYITGYFAGTINLGGHELESQKTAAGGFTDDVFVASFTASGEHRWSRRGGGASTDQAHAIAFDRSGSEPKIHVTGYFGGSARFDQEPSTSDPDVSGPLTSKGSNDIFIASFDAATGSHLGSRGWGGSSSDNAYGIAVDPVGNIYVTGVLSSSNADFGGSITLSTVGGDDIFVASYPPGYASATSSARWTLGFGSAGWDEGRAITLDSSGKVYVTGTFSGEVNFGGPSEPPLTSEGRRDVFVASFNSRGVHDWSIRVGGADDDLGYAIASDGEGKTYVTGDFSDTASFGGDPRESAGLADFFVSSYDASGEHRWSSRAGGPHDDSGFAIVTSPSGDVYSAGRFAGNADFGGGVLTGRGAFVAAHGAGDGAHRASFAIGAPDGADGWARASSIAIGDGFVCAAGYFGGTVTVGEKTLIAIGDQDAFIACFEP